MTNYKDIAQSIAKSVPSLVRIGMFESSQEMLGLLDQDIARPEIISALGGQEGSARLLMDALEADSCGKEKKWRAPLIARLYGLGVNPAAAVRCGRLRPVLLDTALHHVCRNFKRPKPDQQLDLFDPSVDVIAETVRAYVAMNGEERFIDDYLDRKIVSDNIVDQVLGRQTLTAFDEASQKVHDHIKAQLSKDGRDYMASKPEIIRTARAALALGSECN